MGLFGVCFFMGGGVSLSLVDVLVVGVLLAAAFVSSCFITYVGGGDMVG